MILNKITITGVDESTNVDELINICKQSIIPIEIAFLCAGTARVKNMNRYPSYSFIRESAYKLRESNIDCALHLCKFISIDFLLGKSNIDNSDSLFNRIQCNNIRTYEKCIEPKDNYSIIIPSNKSNEDFFKHIVHPNMHVLYDSSGGKGISTSLYAPKHDNYVGYAGGLNSENILNKLNLLNYLIKHDRRIWIDLETGVRDMNDKFCLYRTNRFIQTINSYYEEKNNIGIRKT